MGTKETIAIIGATNESTLALVSKLAREDYRLLLVLAGESHNLDRRYPYDKFLPEAEVEIIDCVKSGCWEADIIVLIGAANFEEVLINKIKEVSTQKIVVGISVAGGEVASFFETTDLQSLLPYSKVVHVFKKKGSLATFIAGDDKEAVQAISALAQKIGFQSTIVDGLLK